MRGFFHGIMATLVLVPLLVSCAPPAPGDSSAGAQSGASSPTAMVDESCKVFGGKKQIIGAVIGTVVGAAAGYALDGWKGALIGGGAGGATGGLIGTAFDHHDCDVAQAALQQSLAEQQGNGAMTVPWTSSTNHSGLFNVQPSYTDATSGQICRQYTSSMTTSSGTQQTGTGVTCRDSSGDWHVI